MSYGRSRFGSTSKVAATACAPNPVSTKIEVSETWGNKGVVFTMRRRSAASRWEILVNQENVPFGDLVGALTELSPVIVKEYPAALAQARGTRSAADAAEEQRRRDEQARKDRARGSYPTK
ncbi:MAG: hypothetical protein EOO75_11270 [Myxococcales bacterium]|nr:MAG: hypothetical protein EOO75_11270 [Myxococcales bacterium]